MDGLNRDTELLHRLVAFTGLRPAALAREADVAVTTINRPFNGSATTRLSQRTLEKLQLAFPDFPGWEDALSSAHDRRLPFIHQPAEVADDSLAIPMLELAYGMGGTFLDDVDPGETLQRFPRAFIRMFTNAPASQLCFSHGIGDSMEPTIGDRDILLIDRSMDTIRINDQIWVLASNGIGMVKRVRVETGGQVKLLSDNVHVPDQSAGEDELVVIGRVIAVVRRI